MSHAAHAPRNHVTDAIMRHAASRDALRAERSGRHTAKVIAFSPKPAKHKGQFKGAPIAFAATPVLAAAPVAWHSGILRSSANMLVVRPAMFIKNVLQGALAGLMTFFGAIQFSGGDIVPPNDLASEFPASVNTVLASLPAGAATGAVGIIGAAILFLNAGRGIARIVGLMGFVALVAAYANGANGDDLIPYLQGIYHQIKGLLPLLAGLGF